MKRKTYLLLTVAFAAILMLAGCSGGSDSGSMKSGEITFKEALERPGTHVWYDVNSPSDGRFAEVRAAFVFKEGTVTIYDSGYIEDKVPNVLGTLEDYYTLSEEDAAALVRDKYRSGYEAYYALLEDELDQFYDDLDNNLSFNDPEKQENALKETYEKLANNTLPEKEPQTFSIVIKADQTGNETSVEAIHAVIQYDDMYDGVIGIPATGYRLYSVVEVEPLDAYVPVQKSIDNTEVYDTWYGGYEADYYELYEKTGTHYLITKCEENTVFTLDPVGTEDIEIIE